MGKLDGRVVLVTGAARGQGEQEVRLFRTEGAEVVVADVLDDQGEALAKEIGALYVHLDVSREDDWTAAVACTSSPASHRPSGRVTSTLPGTGTGGAMGSGGAGGAAPAITASSAAGCSHPIETK